MAIDGGKPGYCCSARQPLAQPIAMYRQIGMPKHVEIAEALLAEV